MKLFLKILGAILLLIILIAAGFLAYLNMTWKKSYADYPRPEIKASTDSAVIARGDYLVHAVAHCSICHQGVPANLSEKEMMEQRKTGVGADLVGGHVWDIPVFGKFVAANLTADKETGIGGNSDGDIARVIRNGVSREGHMLAFMSIAVGQMADEDLIAVISYLRTLKPVAQSNPVEAPGIMGKLVLKNMKPREDAPLKWVPEGGISVERGQYLANGPAACYTCHSTADPMHGFAITGPRFQGEAHAEPDMVDPAFEIAVPNLTPDPETGHIHSWSEDMFVARFKQGPLYKGSKMPWENYGLMTENDVRSIYRYLNTLAPVKHDIGPVRREKGWKPK